MIIWHLKAFIGNSRT